MAPTSTLDMKPVANGMPHNDNSGLRARLSGLVVEHRSIEAELRLAVHERVNAETVIDVRGNAR